MPLCVGHEVIGRAVKVGSEVKTVNASIGLDLPDAFQIQGWVRNLGNDNYFLSAFNTVIQSGSYSAYINEPRTYGITLRKGF